MIFKISWPSRWEHNCNAQTYLIELVDNWEYSNMGCLSQPLRKIDIVCSRLEISPHPGNLLDSYKRKIYFDNKRGITHTPMLKTNSRKWRKKFKRTFIEERFKDMPHTQRCGTPLSLRCTNQMPCSRSYRTNDYLHHYNACCDGWNKLHCGFGRWEIKQITKKKINQNNFWSFF